MPEVDAEPKSQVQVEVVKVLVEHYRDTTAIATTAYRQRNLLLLLLLGAIGIAALLTFRTTGLEELALKSLAGELKQSEAVIKQGLPFAVVESLALALVFFTLVGFYQRSSIMQLYYAYLSEVERSIRAALALPPEQAPFTLQSSFYMAKRSWFLAKVSYWYVLVLGCLLCAVLFGKLWNDVNSKNAWLVAMDLILASGVVFFFVGYARDTLKSANK